MSLMEISAAGSVGLIKDLDDYSIDTAAWTIAKNVQFEDGRAQTIGGRVQAFAASHDPLLLMAYSDGLTNYWIWASQTRIFRNTAIDGNVSIDGPSAPYHSEGAKDWNGTLFNGFVIVNSGHDTPQIWEPSMTACADLPNWPAGTLAKNISGFGARLIAINLTEPGGLRAHKVRWSHPADPGTLPISWDPADPTKTAGEYEFPDVKNGVLVDQLPLRGQHYLYKEFATWRATLRGDNLVYNFDTFMDTAGILAPRCVALTGDGVRHFLVSTDDVVVHDGVTPQSVLDLKARRYFFNQLNPDYAQNTFVFCEPAKKEMWLCYTPVGETEMKMALVWNYKTGTVSETEINFVCAGQGNYDLPDPDTWDTATYTWNEALRTWSATVRKAILVGTIGKALRLNVGNTFDGVVPLVTLQRTGLSLQGKKRDGGAMADLTQRMQLVRVWPRVRGGPVDIRIGAQDDPQHAIRWTPYKTFNPATEKWVDLIAEGGLPAIEFRSQADLSWQLEGFKIDGDLTGEY